METAATEPLSSRYRPPGVLEFRILGPLEVGANGAVRLGGPKQRATLAILLLNANRVVSVERLADDLYWGTPPVTAVTQVQRQISELRKALDSASTIETRSPGYVIHLAPEQLDLNRFERLAARAAHALEKGEAQSAAELFRQALALSRGPPLADLAHEPFVQTAVARLEEIQLAALEHRIEADLTLGRHLELVGELEGLVVQNPLRERFRAQLMLALYRSARQAEALDVYRETRDALVREFGIEPSPALRELERAILVQDPSLDPDPGRTAASAEPDRALLVLPSSDDRVQSLLTIAEPLGRLPARELIVARLLLEETKLGGAASSLNELRASLAVASRTAAFTTRDTAREAVRLATNYDVELVLLDAPPGVDGAELPEELAAILNRSPADVGVLSGASIEWRRGVGIFVPFGGGEHDWAALELGAWLASAARAPLRLVGARADVHGGRRDASRLLADAALAVQRVVGIPSEPLLADPTEEALVEAVEPATAIVVGVSPRWRRDGIGAMRRALVRAARPPTVLVHRGPRPGGLAPHESRTRFSWSLEA
jgi:DNA-binding SARP family transcriptional activator